MILDSAILGRDPFSFDIAILFANKFDEYSLMKVFSLYHSPAGLQPERPNPKNITADAGVSNLAGVKFAGLHFKITDLTHLKRAIELEDMEQLQHLLEKGIDLDMSDDSKETPLIFAAKWRRIKSVRVLLDKGAAPNLQNLAGETALFRAAYNGDQDCVKVLLAHGADPDLPDSQKDTPLFSPAYQGHTETVQALLAHGANPNLPNKLGKTPLSLAALRGRTEIVQALLDHGADPNLSDEEGNTPISGAAQQDHLKSVQMLLEKGADLKRPNNMGRTPLSLAAQMGHTETVQAILAQGVDPNQADIEGKTPVSKAAQHGHTKVVRALLAHGADPNLPDKNGETPLSLAAYNGRLEIVQALLDHGADPNLPDNLGRTPLFSAAMRTLPEIAQVLLAQGANPNLPDQEGKTPLSWAVLRDHTKTVQALLDGGADLNLLKLPGKSALSLVAQHGHTKSVQALLTQGVDPNLPDDTGETPLSLAAQQGHTETVQTLLAHGADPNTQDKEGKTLLYRTAYSGHLEVAQALSAQGADPGMLTPAQQLFLHLKEPSAFLNHMILHQKNFLPAEVSTLFNQVEYQYSIPLGKNLLPELLALLHIYARMVGGDAKLLSNASGAMTRLYGFTNSEPEGFRIDSLQGRALRNWSRIGTLGLSFSRWKFDSMGLWKGAGPSEKPPLLVQSGLFKPVPVRPEDDRYFRSFVHYDPASGLSIELRRAYIVVSKPGAGSVVIRNSSHHFGRDLLAETAYYHPEKVYTHGSDLLNPEEIVTGAGGYMNVLGKTLNKTIGSQERHHKKIQALLEDFQGVMERYTQWKCGFKDGKAPAGFGVMLEAAMDSTANGGVMSPFGKQKNLRLAWVNPYELPAPVAFLNLSEAEVMKEAALYLKILKRQVVMRDAGEYAEKMPMLTAFLAEGLRQGLELVLTA